MICVVVDPVMHGSIQTEVTKSRERGGHTGEVRTSLLGRTGPVITYMLADRCFCD